MNAAIRVVVADDSPFVCRLLASYLNSEAGFQVVGRAHDGLATIERIRELRPDAITLDLEMPGLSGLETLGRIMRELPVPVVVISGVSGHAAAQTLRAIEMGAVDFVLKYTPGSDIDPAALRKEIQAKVRAASRIRVVRSLASPSQLAAAAAPRQESAAGAGASVDAGTNELSPMLAGELVVVGASTGGPLALQELLAALPAGLPMAFVVVQHIPQAFTAVLAAQLRRHCALEVKEAADGTHLRPGVVFVAPGGRNLVVRAGPRVKLEPGTDPNGYCPSIDAAMTSAARLLGSRAVGVLLTGMGDDGAAGMAAIHGRGGVTYAQDPESCVVNGMPQRARDRGAVTHTATPAEIGRLIATAKRKVEDSTYACTR